MDQVEVDSRHVVGNRVESQVAVQRVARLEHDVIARLGAKHGLYGRVIAVEAVRIVLAVGARLGHDHRALPALIAGVGERRPH
jgi:hypothetical protein